MRWGFIQEWVCNQVDRACTYFAAKFELIVELHQSKKPVHNCHQKYRFQICPIGGVKIWIQSEPTTISAPYLLFAYIPGGLKAGKNYSSAP